MSDIPTTDQLASAETMLTKTSPARSTGNNTRALRVFLAETAFWTPFWLLPWAYRMLTHQRHDRAEPWISILMTLLLPYVAAQLGSKQAWFRLAILIVFTLGTLFCTGLAVTHFGYPTPNLMLVTLDTNPSEADEFFAHFLGASDVLTLSLVLIPSIAFVVQWRRGLFWQPRPAFGLVLVGVACGIGALLPTGSATGMSRYFPVGWYPPVKPYIQVVQAFRLRNEISKASSDTSTIANVTAVEPHVSPRTIVVIIGESMAKAHMSLHGYRRPTTPNLDALKARGELFVFEDAVTSQAQTGAALTDAFTWTNPDGGRTANIIDFFNAAGFRTAWISNQPGLGVFDNMAALLTQRATHHVWLRHDTRSLKDAQSHGVEVFQNSGGWAYQPNERTRDNFDENLIPEVRSFLNKSPAKSIVFVHLMGSHAIYRARFPKSVEFFSELPSIPGRSDAQLRTINDYDNSVRYTDTVLRHLIEMAAESGGESAVLYFSDHGEEVHDWRDFAAHSNEVTSPLMLEIPFVLWLSPLFRQNHPEFVTAAGSMLSRRYCNSQFSATLAGLAGFRHASLTENHGLFAASYQSPPRRAVKGDYDELVAKWRPDAAFSDGMTLLPPSPLVARLDAFRPQTP